MENQPQPCFAHPCETHSCEIAGTIYNRWCPNPSSVYETHTYQKIKSPTTIKTNMYTVYIYNLNGFIRLWIPMV
jgi:hypothetical protein